MYICIYASFVWLHGGRPAALCAINLFRKHNNGWLTMHVFYITLFSAFWITWLLLRLLQFFFFFSGLSFMVPWLLNFDQRLRSLSLSLFHRAHKWIKRDTFAITLYSEAHTKHPPPKKAVREMLTTCQDVNTIAVKPRFFFSFFTVCQPKLIWGFRLLRCWFLFFPFVFIYLFFSDCCLFLGTK